MTDSAWTWERFNRNRKRVRKAIDGLEQNALPLAEQYHASLAADLRAGLAELRRHHDDLERACADAGVVAIGAPPAALVERLQEIARGVVRVAKPLGGPADAERQRARMHVVDGDDDKDA